MPKLIDPAQDCERPVQESTDANSVTHPAWCSGRYCWAYPASHDEPENGEEPRPGGCHQSDIVEVNTLNRSPIRLELTLDHGKHEALPELQVTFGDGEDGSTRHLSLDQAADLYRALSALLPGLVNSADARQMYAMGMRQGRKKADADVVEAFNVGEKVAADRVSRETRAALDRIAKRLMDAEKHRQRAYNQGYANGYTDRLDGREPEFEVQR